MRRGVSYTHWRKGVKWSRSRCEILRAREAEPPEARGIENRRMALRMVGFDGPAEWLRSGPRHGRAFSSSYTCSHPTAVRCFVPYGVRRMRMPSLKCRTRRHDVTPRTAAARTANRCRALRRPPFFVTGRQQSPGRNDNLPPHSGRTRGRRYCPRCCRRSALHARHGADRWNTRAPLHYHVDGILSVSYVCSIMIFCKNMACIYLEEFIII